MNSVLKNCQENASDKEIKEQGHHEQLQEQYMNSDIKNDEQNEFDKEVIGERLQEQLQESPMNVCLRNYEENASHIEVIKQWLQDQHQESSINAHLKNYAENASHIEVIKQWLNEQIQEQPIKSDLKNYEKIAYDRKIIEQWLQEQLEEQSISENQHMIQAQGNHYPQLPDHTGIANECVQLEDYSKPENMHYPLIENQAVESGKFTQPGKYQCIGITTHSSIEEQQPHASYSAANHEVAQYSKMSIRNFDDCGSPKGILQSLQQNQQNEVNQYCRMMQQQPTDPNVSLGSDLQQNQPRQQQVIKHLEIPLLSTMQQRKISESLSNDFWNDKPKELQQETVSYQFKIPQVTKQQRAVGYSMPNVFPIDGEFTQKQQYASHSCELCGKFFQLRSDLFAHCIVHEKGNQFACDECVTFKKNKSALQKHYLCQHYNYMPFVCQICFKGCFVISELKFHIRQHLDNPYVICRICELKFRRGCDFELHRLSHVGEKRHVCEYCGKRFYLPCYCRIHEQSHRFMKPFICKICYMAFNTERPLNDHYKEINHPVEEDNTCHTCKETFESKIELLDHYFVHPKESSTLNEGTDLRK